MKKILATILALTMIVGMSLTAFAAEKVTTAEVPFEKTLEVSASFNGNGGTVVDTNTKVYSVDITWESLTLTYNQSGAVYKWDPDKLEYADMSTVGTTGWVNDDRTVEITVTNKSNAAVDVTAAVSGSDFTIAVEDQAFTLGSAAEGVTTTGAQGQAKSQIVDVVAPETISENITATVTITIKAAAAQ